MTFFQARPGQHPIIKLPYSPPTRGKPTQRLSYLSISLTCISFLLTSSSNPS